MAEEKTYIFPEGAGNNGMDTGALLAMMNNNGGFGNGS